MRKKIYQKVKEGILAVVLMLLLPVAIASIYILAPETQDATLMMLHPYFFIYVILIALAEVILLQLKEVKGSKGVAGIAVLLILVIGYRNYLVTNEAYFRMEIAFDRTYAYYNRIISNVEVQSGYHYGDALAIIGEFYPEPNPLEAYDIDAARFTEFSGIAMENGLLTSGSRREFLRTYLGIDLPELTDEEIDVIKNTTEYQKMPVYPAVNSIRKIDQVWVVKVHE